ncbi:chromosome partitioning protein ParA [Clostridia bacterium]|nr:chromosome partitioning protein ParA [Clostridia bacterium]
MKKLAFYNNKGGVGKTTSCINVAYALAEMGKRVLVADCDVQRNLLGFFTDETAETPTPTRYSNIDISAWSGDTPNQTDYDYILLDMPPARNDEVRNLLRQADFVFVPITPTTFSLQGIAKVMEIIAEADTPFGGCYVARFNKSQNTTHQKLLDVIREQFGDSLMNTIIPQSNVIENSIEYRVTAFEYMKWTNAAVSLGDLTAEILERVGD